jgi:hypothetical protein
MTDDPQTKQGKHMTTEAPLPDPLPSDAEAPELGPQHFDPKDLIDPVFPGGRWLDAKIARTEPGRNKADAKYGAGARNFRIEYQVFVPEDADVNGRLFRPFPITTDYTAEGAPFGWVKWCQGVGINTSQPFDIDPMDWIGADVQIKLEVIQVGEGMNRRKTNRLTEIRQPVV